MKLIRRTSAFTLIELLVVITIIGILITITVPAINGALDSARMTQVLANARSLQIATAAMAMDSLNSSDPNALDWTSKMTGQGANGQGQPAKLTEYFTALTENSAYLSMNDLKKLLTAPGKNPQAQGVQPGPDNIAFNFFQVDSNSPSIQVFVATQNWTKAGGLGNNMPFGKKGFVYFTKGGGGGVKKKQTDATSQTDFPAQDENGANLNYTPIN